MNKFSRAELTEKIYGVVHRVNLDNKDPGQPCYTLPEMLERKNLTTLRKMAKYHRLSRYSKMGRDELTPQLITHMTDPEHMAHTLLILDEYEWKMFQKAAKVDEIIDDKLLSENYKFLIELGYLALYYSGEHFHYIIPSEVRRVYNDALVAQGFPAEKNHADLLNDYAIAATNLYGVITIDELVDLFNTQNRRKTDEDELFSTLIRYVYMDLGYVFWHEYIVNDDFEENDYRDVEAYAKIAASKPRYTPSKKEFLKYSEWDYIEQTPQVKALRAFIRAELDVDEDMAEDLVEESVILCKYDAKMQDRLDPFDDPDFKLTFAQTQKLVHLLNELHNNTRLWINNGHTPNELFQMDKQHLLPLPGEPARSTKIGRNEPCPCGSGKKYKKCCGRGIIYPAPAENNIH